MSPVDGDDTEGTGGGTTGDDEVGLFDGAPRTAEVVLAPVPHSVLVGFMGESVSRSIPVRRSTVLMLLAFLGFATMSYLYPPTPSSTTVVTTNNPNGLIPGLVPASTTTTRPSTTTTTTAQGASTTTTMPPGSSTTTTGASGASTSTTVKASPFLKSNI